MRQSLNPDSAPPASIVWHDYETFGIRPERDFPAQFAAVRTDFDLNVLGDGESFYCQLPNDYLPDPSACWLTGISPQQVLRDGLPEPEFAKRIYGLLARPGTVSCGYNSMRFDEEFTRQLLWRNFYPVYEREFQNDNARFDLIDVLRMAYALRPDGLQWPVVDGKVSFKLENLSAANELQHEQAHDALHDVHATIALAQKLKAAQPKLWQHAFALRKKAKVNAYIDVLARTPLVHVSQRFAAERGCLAIWQPICQHPNKSNEWIGVDLAHDIGPLLELDADAIAERIFIKQADLPEGELRIAIKTIHSNRAPMLAPLSVLNHCDHARIQLDLPSALQRAELIKHDSKLANKLQQVYAQQALKQQQAVAPQQALKQPQAVAPQQALKQPQALAPQQALKQPQATPNLMSNPPALQNTAALYDGFVSPKDLQTSKLLRDQLNALAKASAQAASAVAQATTGASAKSKISTAEHSKAEEISSQTKSLELAASLKAFADQFNDARLTELLWRLRARWYPQSLDLDEQQRWRKSVQDHLQFDSAMNLTNYHAVLDQLAEQAHSAAQFALLDQLRSYGQSLTHTWFE